MRLISYFLVLLVPNLVSADATINVLSDQGNATIYVKNQKVVFKSVDDNGNDAIFVPAESSLYMIDHKNNSYTIMNEQKIAQLSQTIGSAMSALEEQLKNMPPEQREKMKQMMGNFGMNMPEPVSEKTTSELVATGSKNYGGFSCKESNIIEGEKLIGKICLSDGNTLGLSSEDYDLLLQAQQFMFSLAEKAGELAGQFGQPVPDMNGAELNGLIIAGENKNSDDTSGFNVTNINNEAGDISTEIPEGYTEQKLPSKVM